MKNIIVNSLVFVCSILWLPVVSLSNPGMGLVFGQATPMVTAIPTPQAPTVTTEEVGNLEYDGDTGMYTAMLTGTVNAHGLPTTAWFEYGTSSGSYSGTSTTQGVNGTSNTEISININNIVSNALYYYRIVAENSLGLSHGNEESFLATSDCTCRVCGKVKDAITGEGIKDAVVSYNEKTIHTYFGSCGLIEEYGVFVWEDEDKFPCYNIYTIELTASAEGYTPLTQEVVVSPCGLVYGVDGGVEFALQPITTPIPTPIVTSTPECKAKSIEVLPKRLKLKRGQSNEVTVVLEGDNCVPEGKTVTAKIGSNRILISSMSEVTDKNGEAKFIVTAKDKIGNAKVIFKVGSLKKSIIVKVRS